RGWINCSEPVRLRSMRSFAESFSDWGVTQKALQASYAMAENVFAVTQSEPGKPASTFPRAALRGTGINNGNLSFDILDDVYVSSGRPLADVEIRIADRSRQACVGTAPGEIEIRTPSLFSGYWGSEGFRKRPFAEDGWYHTGDYGFLDGDELYVIGRTKDIVIVGGQNVFPEDVE